MPDPRRPKLDPFRILERKVSNRVIDLRHARPLAPDIADIEKKTAEVIAMIAEVYERSRKHVEELRLEKTIIGRARLRWRRYVERVRVTYEVIRLERRIKLARAKVVRPKL